MKNEDQDKKKRNLLIFIGNLENLILSILKSRRSTSFFSTSEAHSCQSKVSYDLSYSLFSSFYLDDRKKAKNDFNNL